MEKEYTLKIDIQGNAIGMVMIHCESGIMIKDAESHPVSELVAIIGAYNRCREKMNEAVSKLPPTKFEWPDEDKVEPFYK